MRLTAHTRYLEPLAVLTIRSSDDSLTALSRRFNVSRGCIAGVRYGHSYKDIGFWVRGVWVANPLDLMGEVKW